MGISKARIRRLSKRLLGSQTETLTIIADAPFPTKVEHLAPEEVDRLKEEKRYWDNYGGERGHWVWPKRKTYTPEEKAEMERQIRLGQLLVIRDENGEF